MSYDLDVRAGDVDDDEGTRPPLDASAAHHVLGALPDAAVADDEVVWELDGAAVTFSLVPDEQGLLRSVGATVTDATEPSARRRDARRILDVLLDLAERLGARLHDPQLGTDVDRATADESVRSFAGG